MMNTKLITTQTQTPCTSAVREVAEQHNSHPVDKKSKKSSNEIVPKSTCLGIEMRKCALWIHALCIFFIVYVYNAD